MPDEIRVGVLDDHQGILDGMRFRLEKSSRLKLVASASYAQDLEAMLEEHQLDLLFLDISVPIAPDNPSPYPILHDLPKLMRKHPDLAILVVSMHKEPALVKAIMETGASGYIVKDDAQAIQTITEIAISVADGGGVYLSKSAAQYLVKRRPSDDGPTLTPRQKEMLSLCASHPELKSAEIADKMNIAPSTLRNTFSDIYERLGVRSRPAAVKEAQRLGLIPPNSLNNNL